MAIAVDASTPVSFNGVIDNTGPDNVITSASFTAPTDALLVCCICGDDDGVTDPAHTVSDTGGLTWTLRVTRSTTEATAGGNARIYTARTTSSVSRTVTVTCTAGGLKQCHAKVYVLTGVDVDGTPVDTVGASNEGGSGTNDLTTTSVTPGGTGLLMCADTDWSAQGVFTSSDLTIDTADYALVVSVCTGYKTCTSGVGVTGNLNAGGGGPAQHKWCQIVVRELPTSPTSPNVTPDYSLFPKTKMRLAA